MLFHKHKPPQEGEEGFIRFSSRERLRYANHRRLLTGLLAAGLVLLFAVLLLLVMKNYTDQKIAQANNLLAKESNQYNELEKRIYERENFRTAYDLFAPNMVGVAREPATFTAGDPKALYTGVIYGVKGYVLVPAEVVRGLSRVYVRLIAGSKEFIHEGYVLGIDEASGLAILDVPSIDRDNPVNLTPNKPALAQTLLLIALPKGDPETGNLIMGEVHTREDLYTLETTAGPVKLSVFFTTAPVYHGNDGGAAVTMDGRLAGMASLELTRRLGVAPNTALIPASELDKIISRIVDPKSSVNVSLGIEGQLVEVTEINRNGFYVLEVAPDSTAQRGGIRPTDIILAIDGEVLTPERPLSTYLTGKRPGDSVTIGLYRQGKILSFIMKIY